ncbi:SPOR domain-containing protein [Nitratireductor basaltis]|uniref:Sporulation related protein n=1 Tax=Nitratireductor basaltis TaxID=472175 RepID=A0A084UA90_9HYPH|nr:SPOR domain-containing protein [Nitratireductor basaltis]KFB09876.1 Sporulation related protein [Nitratireductor basaltis]
MADSNFANRVEPNLVAEDDPFAELTRIMGHDPRSSSSEAPASSQAQDDLALDLESELLGDLARENFHGEPQAEVLPFRGGERAEPLAQQEPAVQADAQEDLGDLLSDADFDASFTAAFEDFQEQPEPQSVEAAPAPAPAPQPVENDLGFELSEDDLAAFDNDFAMEEEFAAVADDFSPAEEASSEDAAEPEPAFDFARAAASRPDFSADRVVAGDNHYQPVAQPQAVDPQPEAQAESDDWSSEALFQEFSQSMQASLGVELGTDTETREEAAYAASAPVEPTGAETSRYSQPEIDTVDVPDEAVPQTDQLDLPEVDYHGDKPVQGEFDDLEELLSGAFGEGSGVGAEEPEPQWAEAAAATAVAAPAAAVAATTASAQTDYDDDYFDSVYQPGAQGAAAFGASAQAAPHFGAPVDPSWGDFDETEARLAPAPGAEPPYHTAAPWYQSRNVMAGAAAALGIFILGGVGYYAFSSGDEASSGPVIVRADEGPIKVRPENPGGVQIPNQDNPVYKKVSGASNEPKAEQTELVSTTEEPIDVAARVPAAPSQPSPVASADTAKSEERLETAGDQDGSAGSDTVTLAPRMVRSLVVRPDGTMAPRELPKPQPQTAEGAAPADTQTGNTAAEEQTAVQQVSLPATPSAVPTQRPSRPAAAQAAPVQPQAPAQQQVAAARAPAAPQPAAAQPAAPQAPAASSGWSVQIASQPSAAGAQQSYQQMAQRYGNLLQGRGVNIVKADIAGKGTYYRVRIPSSSKDDAIQLCSQLKSAGGSCFVSK